VNPGQQQHSSVQFHTIVQSYVQFLYSRTDRTYSVQTVVPYSPYSLYRLYRLYTSQQVMSCSVQGDFGNRAAVVFWQLVEVSL
jgi:hypothetical protein